MNHPVNQFGICHARQIKPTKHHERIDVVLLRKEMTQMSNRSLK